MVDTLVYLFITHALGFVIPTLLFITLFILAIRLMRYKM